jgi:hypothetical protein
MKTEEEIRKHRQELRDCLTPGCRCPDCVGNTIAINVLSWVLGEMTFDPHIEELFQAQVAANRRKKGGG